MRVADSSFLIAFASQNDRFHAEALAWMESPEPIHVPLPILAETTQHLALKWRPDAARAFVEDLRRLPHVRIGLKVDSDAVLDRFLLPSGKLSLADCVVVQVCKAGSVQPLTFDREILSAVDGLPT